MGQTLRVLSVFESPRDGEAVRRLLDEAPPGFLVVDAGSREAFEAALAAGEFDAVLTDLGVLGFDGLSILDAVRARHPRVPVVVVSGVDSAERAVEAMKRGAADYLLKTPSQLQRLPHAIRAAVERAEQEEKLRRATEDLRDSQEVFCATFERAAVGIVHVAPDGRFLRANQSFCDLLGYTREKILASQTIRSITHPDDFDADVRGIERVLAGEAPTHSMEKRYVRKDGSIVWVEITVSLVRNAAGGPEYLTGFVTDITVRKRAEEALRKSEELHREAQGVAHIGHWELVPETGTPTWSDEVFRIFGLDPEQGEPSFAAHQNHIHPEDWDLLNHSVQEASTAGTPFDIEFRLLRPGDEIRWMHAVGTTTRDENGKVSRLFGTAQDITDLKRVETALRESEEKYRLVTGNIPVVVYSALADEHSTTLFLSGRNEELTGYSAQEFKDDPGLYALTIHPDDRERVWAGIREHRRDKTPLKVEYRILTKDGAVKWVRDEATPMLGPDGQVARIDGFMEDITERKAAEQALEDAARFPAENPHPVLRIAGDGTLLYANAASESLLGEWGCALGGSVPEEWRERVAQALVSAKGQRVDIEHRGLTLSFMLVPVLGAGYVNLYGRDVTEHRRAQEALQASETRYHQLFDQMSSGVAVYRAWNDGEDFVFVDFNQAGQRIDGIPNEEVVGRRVTEVFSGVRDLGLLDVFRRVWRTGAAEHHPAGIYRDQRVVGWRENFVYKLPTGEIVAVYEDVTERKQAGEALRESEQSFRTIFEGASDGLFVLDLETRKFVMCNAMSSRMLGYTQEEFLNLDIPDLHPPEDMPFILEQVGKFIEGGTGVRNDIRFRRKDGTLFHADLSPASMTLAGRESILVVFKDITERKRAEAELRSSREQLRSLAARIQNLREEERTRMAREIHDELGHALTALKMDITLCGKKTGSLLPPDARDALARKLKPMAASVDQMVETVRRIATELRPAILDHLGLGPAIEWLAQQFQNRERVRCRLWLHPAGTQLDPKRSTELFRMLQELLTNVMRHARATEADITLRQQEGSLMLEVRDDGIGITPEEAVGAGSLGLLGLRERARLLGGELAIAGSPGKGTTATVRIPLRAGQEEHNGNPHRG